MATLFVDKVDPQSGTNLEIGSSGDTVALGSGATQTIAVNTPMVSLTMSAGQTTTDATATLVTFDTAEIDTDNAYTNTAGNYKFTVPSGKAGTYMITVMFTSFNENSDTEMVQGYIYKNGAAISYQRQRNDGGGDDTRHAGTTSHWVGTLAEGDYIQFYHYHSVSSASPTIQGTQQARATITRLIT